MHLNLVFLPNNYNTITFSAHKWNCLIMLHHASRQTSISSDQKFDHDYPADWHKMYALHTMHAKKHKCMKKQGYMVDMAKLYMAQRAMDFSSKYVYWTNGACSNPLLIVVSCLLILRFTWILFADYQQHACWIIVHSTYCGKVTLASQFEVTEESLYGIRIAQFRTVGALEVKASSSALIWFPKDHKTLQA